MTRNDRIIELVVGPDVLDIGCSDHSLRIDSPYWLHGQLLKKFPEVVGIDLNAENIQEMKKMGFKDLITANAENFELDTQFDTIVAGELIEHLSNPGHFFLKCQKHLKPSGRLVISTPYAFSLLYIFYALLKYPKTCQNEEHAVWFCPQTLMELASRYGFYPFQWELIEDYEFDNSSILYWAYVRFMTTVGRILLPARLRKNNMLFVFRFKEN